MTDRLTFSIFDKPVEKDCFSIGDDKEHKMKYGTVHRERDKAVGGKTTSDYYFYIDPLWGSLVFYEYNFEEDYSTAKREAYDFEVIDNNSIKIERIVYKRE